MSATYANNYGGNRNGYDGYAARPYDGPPSFVPRGAPSSLTSSNNTLDTKVTDEDISRQFEEERINKLKDQRAEVQKKVFTRWMNSHLRQKNRPCQVADLFEDIRDGKALMELMYCLTGEPMNPNPGVLRVQRVENVNRCIEKLEDKLQDKLVNIGAVDIVDSNRIAILGLLWTIILRFQVQTTTETPGEVADFYAERESIRPQHAGYLGEGQAGGPSFGTSTTAVGGNRFPEHLSASQRADYLNETAHRTDWTSGQRGPVSASAERGGVYYGSGQIGSGQVLSGGPNGHGGVTETVGLGSNLTGSALKGRPGYFKGGDAGGGAGFYPPEKQRELQRIEEAVLMWAKSKCVKYGIDVQNFSTSWRDGQAFCALIHSQCGDDAIDMAQVRPGANRDNLNYAFTAAEQLGVDRLLEPEEVDVRNPDSRLILTYVTHLYHNLAKRQGEQIGGRRVAKIVTTLMKIDAKKAHYMEEVQQLRAWLKTTEEWLNNRDFPTDTSELQRCLTYFKDRYLAEEKPRKMNERDATEAELVVIHTTLAGLNMPRWMPPPGTTLRDIGADWDRLLEAEHNRQTALHAALQQSERLDLMAAQFHKRAKIRSDWLDDISARLAAERTPLDDRSAESLLKRYEALSTEIFGVEDRFDVISQIAQKLTEGGYHDSEGVSEQLADLLERRDTLKAEVHRRLEAASLYTMVLGMLQQLRTVAGELSDVQQACQSTNYGQHLLEVAELLERHNNVNTDLKSVGHVLAEIGQHLRQLRDERTAASSDVAPTLEAALRELEDVEKTYELCKGLVESRQQGLLLSQQYHHLVDDCREETAWLREKQMQFDSMEIGRDLTQAQAQARKFDVIQGELSARWTRTEKLLASGGRLADAPSIFVMSSSGSRPPPQPQPTADIKLLCDRLLAEWERVRQRAADRRKLLDTSVKLHKLVSDMEEAGSWLAEKEQVLSNTDFGDDSLSAAALLRRCLQTKDEITSYEETLKKLNASVTVALSTTVAENTADAIPVVEKLIALYAYSGRNFDMRKGDILELVQRTNKDWWLTRRICDGRQGYVPANYVRLHPPETMDTRLTHLNDRYMRLRAMADQRERNLGEATRFYQFRDSCEQMLAWIGVKRQNIADFAATKLPTPPPAEVGRVSQLPSRSPLPHSISKSVAKEMVDFQKTLSASFASQSGKLGEIKGTADTMLGDNHPQSEQITALRGRVEAEWADLQQMKLEFEQRAQGMSNLELFEQTVNEALELINRRLGHWEEQMDRCEDPIRQDFFFQNEINIIQERLAKADRLAKAVAESYPEESGAVRKRQKQLTDAWAQLEGKKKQWQERIDLLHSKRQFEDESHAVLKWLERTTMQLQADATLNTVALPTEERANKVAELETEMRQWIGRLDHVVQLGLRAQAAGDPHAEEMVQQITARRYDLAELAEQFETSVEQQQARERFLSEANSIESKLKEYETMLSVVDLGESVDAAEKLYKRIKDDVERKSEMLQERVAGLQQLSADLTAAGHPDEAQFAGVAVNLITLNKRVTEACAERLKLLSDSVKMHQWLADCADFLEWCEEKVRLVPADASDLTNDPAGIDKRNAKHVAIESEINRNARKKEDLVSAGVHMQEFAECDMPSSKQEAVDDAMMRLNSVWEELQTTVGRRREMLDAFVNELKLQRTLIASEERLRIAEARLASGQEIGPMSIADNLRSAARAVQRNSTFSTEINEDIAYLKSTSQLQQHQGRMSQAGLPSGMSAATSAQITDLIKRYEGLKGPSAAMKRKMDIQKAYYELLIELKIELQWIAERMSIVDSTRLGSSLWEAQSQMQKFRQVDLDLKGHEQPLSRLLAKSQEVVSETDKDPAPIHDLVENVKTDWQRLKDAADKRRKLLEDVLAVQQCVAEVDDLEQGLGDARRLVSDLEGQTDIITVNSAAIDRQLRRQQRLAKELETRSHQLSKLMATVKPLSSLVPMAEDLPKRLEVIGSSVLNLHDRVDKVGAKLKASQLYYAWASETSEFSEWIQHNMHMATSQDYGHDSESLKALEDKFDEFFRMVDARSEHYDEISRLSETLIGQLKAVGNQHLIEQVNARRIQLNETWQGLLGHCARRRSNFAAARILHQFHQDLDDIQALIAEKRAQISTEMGRDLQSVGCLVRQHDFLFDEVRSVEVRVSELLKAGDALQLQFPGPNAENIKERCAETEEKIRQLTLAIEQRGTELDNSEHFFNFIAQSKRALTAADELVRELDALSMFELDLVDQLINEIAVKGQIHLADLAACTDKGRQLIESHIGQYQPEIERRIMELESMNQRYEKTLADKRLETQKALTRRHFERQLAEISEKAIDLANKLNRMSCSEFARTSASTTSLIAAAAVAGGDPLRAAELRLAEADATCKVFDQQMDEIVAQVKPMRELDRAVGVTSQYVHQARKTLDAKRDELNQATLYRDVAVEANDLENWLENKTALLRRAAQELEKTGRSGETPVSDEIEDRIAQLRRFQSVESEMRHYEPQYKHVLRLASEVGKGIDQTLAQAANDHSIAVQNGWQTLIDVLSRQTESLNNYRLLLQFIELCQSIEAWIADREMLVLAKDLGEDYEHCHELYTRVQTEADIAGDVVTNQSEVATKISEINKLSHQLAEKDDIREYVYDRVTKINGRWALLDENRSKYLNSLKVALEAHKFVLDCDQLIGQLQSIESLCTTDISGLNQSELELVGRKQNVVERELGIVQNQLERLEGHAEKLASECPLLANRILARNQEVSDLLERVSNVCNNRHLELDCMLKLYKLFSDINKLAAFAARTIQEMQEVFTPQSSLEAQSIVEQHEQRESEIKTRQREVEIVLQSAEQLARERPATEDVARRFAELLPASDRLRKVWAEMVEEWKLHKDLFEQHKEYQAFLQLEFVADQWIQSKLPLPTDLGSSMNAADALLQDHQKLVKTIEAQSTKITDLVTHFETKIKQNHFAYTELLDRVSRITNKYHDLSEGCQSRLRLLDDSRRYHRWMTLSGDMLDWISDRLEALDDSPSSSRSALALTDLGGVSARLRHQIGIESEIVANRDLHETLLRRGMVLTGAEAGMTVSARILESVTMVTEVEKRCHELKHSWGALEVALQRRHEMLDDAKEISALQSECDRLVRWVSETEGQLSQEDYRMLDDTDAVDMRLRQHEALQGDLEFRRNKLIEMAERADRLCQRGHGLGKDVAAAVSDVDQRVRALDEPMTIHRNNLLDALELCNLRRDIARELVWVGDRAELAASGNLGDSLAHVVTLKKRHERLVQEIEAHGRFIEDIGKRAEVLLARQREAAADVRQRFQTLVEALDRLRLAAEDRLKRLEEAMQSHRFYAELTDSMNWINAKQRTLNDTFSQLSEDSVHDLAGQLDLISQETKEYASTIKDVEELATALINRRHFDSSNIDAKRAGLLQAYNDLCRDVDFRVEKVRNWRRLFSVRRQLRDACRQASDWLRTVQLDECGRDLEQCESIMADLSQLVQQIQIGETRMDDLCREAGEFEVLGDADLLQQLGYLGQLRASVREWIGSRQQMLEDARSIHAFLREADDTIAWIADKEPGVFSKDLGHDYETAQRLLQKHISVERDLQALSSRMESLHKKAEALSQAFPEAQSRIAVKYTTAANQWSAIVQQWQKRKEDLEHALSLQHFLAEYRRVVSWFYDAYKHMTVEHAPRDIETINFIVLQHGEFYSELRSHQDGLDKLLQAGDELLRTAVSEDEQRLIREKMDNVQEALLKFVETWRSREVEYKGRLDVLKHSHALLEVEGWLSKHEAAVKTQETGFTVAEVDEHFATLRELELSLPSIEPRVNELKQQRTPFEIATDRSKEAANRQRLNQLRLNEEERVSRDRRRRDERRRTGEVTPAIIAAARLQQQQQQQGQFLQPQPQEKPVSVSVTTSVSTVEVVRQQVASGSQQFVPQCQQPAPPTPQPQFQQQPQIPQPVPQWTQPVVPPSPQPQPQPQVQTQPPKPARQQQASEPRQSFFSVLSQFPSKHLEPAVVIDTPSITFNNNQEMAPEFEEPQQLPEQQAQNFYSNGSYDEYDQQNYSRSMSPPPVGPPPPPPQQQQVDFNVPSAVAPMYVNIPPSQQSSSHLQPPQPQGKRRQSVTFHETVTEIQPPLSDEELTPGAQQLVLKPQEKVYTPKQAPPVSHSGVLHRKHVYQPGGRSAPIRSWKELYVVLSGQLLSFYSSKKDFDALRHSSAPLSLAGAHCEPAPDYHKRANVFRLRLPDKSEYLFSTRDNFQLLEWVRRIEYYATIDPRHQLDEYQPQQHAVQHQKQLNTMLASQQQPSPVPVQQAQQSLYASAPSPPQIAAQPVEREPSPQPRPPQVQPQVQPQPSPTQIVTQPVYHREPSPQPPQLQETFLAPLSPPNVEEPSPAKQPMELSPSSPLVVTVTQSPPPPQNEPLPPVQQGPASPALFSQMVTTPVSVSVEQPLVIEAYSVSPPHPVQPTPPKMSLFMLPPAAPPPTMASEQEPTHDAYKNLLEDEQREQQSDYVNVEPTLSASLNASLMSFGSNRRQPVAAAVTITTTTPEKRVVEPAPAALVVQYEEAPPPKHAASPKLVQSVLGDEIEEYENLDSVPRARRAGSNEGGGSFSSGAASTTQPQQQQPFSPIEENQNRSSPDDQAAMKPLTIELNDQQPAVRVTTPPVPAEAQPAAPSSAVTGSGRRRRPSLEAAAGEDDDGLLGAFDKGTDLLGPTEPVAYGGVPPPAIEPLSASPRGARMRQDDSPQLSPAGFPPRQGSLPSSHKQKNRLLDRIGGSFKFNKKK